MEVFETEDVDEGPRLLDVEDEKSDAVQILGVSVRSSFSRFNGKSLDTKGVDFSDQILSPGSLSNQHHSEESVLQRFQRLKMELTELQECVHLLQQRDYRESQEVSPAELLQEVDAMQSELSRLHLEPSPALLNHPNSTVLLQDLKLQLENSKSTGNEFSYEVYSCSESAKLASLSKLSEVEKRLTNLEALVGNEDETVSIVSAGLDVEPSDLSTAVLNLQAKVALLDSAHVSAISGQLKALIGVLEEVKKKLPEVDLSLQPKLSEALKTVDMVGVLAPLVPHLVKRLHSLRELHDRAALFAGTLRHMSTCQDNIEKQLASLRSMLSKVHNSLEQNLFQVHSNLSSVEERIVALQ